jgi:hypothetical protein
MAAAERPTTDAATKAAEATPREDDIVRNFRDVAYWVLGEPREINAIWSSTDSSGIFIGEKAHLRIAPATQLYPATADFSAMIRPAVDDPSESLSLGHVRTPESLPQFPIIPAKLDFGEKAQLNSGDLAQRKKMEQAVLKQGVAYLMAVPRLLDMPDTTVIEITKGSGNNPPVETLRVSPTEIIATFSITEFDKRTIRAVIEIDRSVDLSVTNMVAGADGRSNTTQKCGIEALVDAKAAVESFFPGFAEFFKQKRPAQTTAKPATSDL